MEQKIKTGTIYPTLPYSNSELRKTNIINKKILV